MKNIEYSRNDDNSGINVYAGITAAVVLFLVVSGLTFPNGSFFLFLLCRCISSSSEEFQVHLFVLIRFSGALSLV